MKVQLKDYQADAVAGVLRNLTNGRDIYRSTGRTSGFALSATTGAGKTVAAAAVIEALFYGEDTHGFLPDPGAVVLWFSDDPALNEQSRFRLLEVSDRLGRELQVVESSFNEPVFRGRRVYFLNTQKLRAGSLLTRGYQAEGDPGTTPLLELRPDDRAVTLYDTLRNTIEDPDLTLYLVLDEAHRGMGSTKASAREERNTIVKRLINGAGDVPPVPVVWGISATVDRFTQAMAGATDRVMLGDVVVDSAQVQASGLLKDTIVLDSPTESGPVEQVLLRRATGELRNSTAVWAAYAASQDEPTPVVPLMVFQLPNTPEPAQVARWLDTVQAAWPQLTPDSFAHVLGEHRDLQYGGWTVPWVAPERVQDDSAVRVLLAKDAISTGWDCPRAEVMVSFRPAQDATHITQLLGRMIRTPLARRIPGNDRLNAVHCLLPLFNPKAVKAVADTLMTGSGGDTEPGGLTGRRVLIDPVDTTPNPAVPEPVWQAFAKLPSQTIPRRVTRPVRRLTALAHELAADKLLGDAGKKAHTHLHKVLDAARALFGDEITAARQAVYTVTGQTMVADLRGRAATLAAFEEAADTAVIEDAYRAAGRVLSPDLARTYAEHLADLDPGDGDRVDALLTAHGTVAALGLVPDVRVYLDAAADKLTAKWLDEYRVVIKSLTDDRRDVYREFRQQAATPQDVDLVRSESRLENSRVQTADGTVTDLPALPGHLMCAENGLFPVDLNDWETAVLDREMSRSEFAAWYRNPARATQDSFAVAYSQPDGRWSAVRPDFLVFTRRADGSIAANIVDPHGFHLGDAHAKLLALADYAEQHPTEVLRVDAIAKIGDILRVLDLTAPTVRTAVRAGTDVRAMYAGKQAADY